jgi:hypothetical protein
MGMKTIKIEIGEASGRDVRMLIPPKELATGLFRRGGTCTSDAEMVSEPVPAEYQRKMQRESSCR